MKNLQKRPWLSNFTVTLGLVSRVFNVYTHHHASRHGGPIVFNKRKSRVLHVWKSLSLPQRSHSRTHGRKGGREGVGHNFWRNFFFVYVVVPDRVSNRLSQTQRQIQPEYGAREEYGVWGVEGARETTEERLELSRLLILSKMTPAFCHSSQTKITLPTNELSL